MVACLDPFRVLISFKDFKGSSRLLFEFPKLRDSPFAKRDFWKPVDDIKLVWFRVYDIP